jgi:hypothetical protein
MSKKITEAMMKGLVEQVLNEINLPVDFDGDNPRAKELKKKLSMPTFDGTKDKKSVLKTIKKDQDNDQLSRDDIEQSFDTSDLDDDAAKGANIILQKTNDPELQNAIQALRQNSKFQKSKDFVDQSKKFGSLPIEDIPDSISGTNPAFKSLVKGKFDSDASDSALPTINQFQTVSKLDNNSANLSAQDVALGLTSTNANTIDAAKKIYNLVDQNSKNKIQATQEYRDYTELQNLKSTFISKSDEKKLQWLKASYKTNVDANKKDLMDEFIKKISEGHDVDVAQAFSKERFKPSKDKNSLFQNKNIIARVMRFAKKPDALDKNFSGIKIGAQTFYYYNPAKSTAREVMPLLNYSGLAFYRAYAEKINQKYDENLTAAKELMIDNATQVKDQTKPLWDFATLNGAALTAAFEALSANYFLFSRVIEVIDELKDENALFEKMGETLRGTKKDVEVTKNLKRTSISDPALMSQAAGAGEMLESQFNMFNTFFEGTKISDSPLETLVSRIKKLTEFSNKVFKNPTLNEIDGSVYGNSPFDFKTNANSSINLGLGATLNKYVDFSNKLMMLDYFSTFAKELDHGSAAYLFEAFCAYLAGGSVAGKASGAAGGMGETDFYFDDGSKGSAKYLQASRTFSQAEKNFIKNSPVTYVFASKKKQSGAGVSDPDELAYIDFYVLTIEKLSAKITDVVRDSDGKVESFKRTFKITKPSGPSKEESMQIVNGKLQITVDSADRVGTLSLMTTSKETLSKAIESYAQELDSDTGFVQDQFEKLTAKIKNAFQQIESSKDSVSNLVNTGEITHAKSARDSFTSAKQSVDEIEVVIKDSGTKTLSESKKITASFLKKLIQEKFKK